MYVYIYIYVYKNVFIGRQKYIYWMSNARVLLGEEIMNLCVFVYLSLCFYEYMLKYIYIYVYIYMYTYVYIIYKHA
jgi:hypothetical protein